jgi:thiamine biosynthesis lipoprotein
MRQYGFYDDKVEVPGAVVLARTLTLVGMDKVHVDRQKSTVSFEREGMRLDFGGIGKGLALDRAVKILRGYGVERALLHGGTSTVYALGAPPGEPGWKVGIRHPYNNGEHVAEVVLCDESLSTSGCYGGGANICDVLDPRTGQPVVDTLSATAIAPSATLTDALSTSFLVLGLDGTRRYCESGDGVRAIVVPASTDRQISVEWIRFNESR